MTRSTRLEALNAIVPEVFILERQRTRFGRAPTLVEVPLELGQQLGSQRAREFVSRRRFERGD
jgi:hypothetical protein